MSVFFSFHILSHWIKRLAMYVQGLGVAMCTVYIFAIFFQIQPFSSLLEWRLYWIYPYPYLTFVYQAWMNVIDSIYFIIISFSHSLFIYTHTCGKERQGHAKSKRDTPSLAVYIYIDGFDENCRWQEIFIIIIIILTGSMPLVYRYPYIFYEIWLSMCVRD